MSTHGIKCPWCKEWVEAYYLNGVIDAYCPACRASTPRYQRPYKGETLIEWAAQLVKEGCLVVRS